MPTRMGTFWSKRAGPRSLCSLSGSRLLFGSYYCNGTLGSSQADPQAGLQFDIPMSCQDAYPEPRAVMLESTGRRDTQEVAQGS